MIVRRGNKCQFWQIFVHGSTQRISESFIQLENSTSTHESNRTSKYVMLLSNFGDEYRELNPVSEVGFHHQLVLVSPTDLRLNPHN